MCIYKMILSFFDHIVSRMGKYLVAILTIFVIFKNGVEARSELRIINGTDALEGELPYMVPLYDGWETFICGGTILSELWILTSWTCVGGESAETVMYGTNDLNNLTRGFPNNSVKIKDWYRHPKWDYNSAGAQIYDVGLLELKTPLPMGDKVQAIKLPEANATLPYHIQGVLSGWGVNVTGSRTPLRHLQKINVELLTDEECTEQINGYSGRDSFQSEHHICTADNYNGGCSGDTGGAFVINGTQWGIMSWAYTPCGRSPSAYSRITNPEYRDWIKQITGI